MKALVIVGRPGRWKYDHAREIAAQRGRFLLANLPSILNRKILAALTVCNGTETVIVRGFPETPQALEKLKLVLADANGPNFIFVTTKAPEISPEDRRFQVITVPV